MSMLPSLSIVGMKGQANGGGGEGGISVGNITTWHRGILAITTLPVPPNFSTLLYINYSWGVDVAKEVLYNSPE